MLIKSLYKYSTALGAGLVALTVANSAFANNFSLLAKNVTTSITDVPGLLTAVCYLFGIILVILGILKIKEHVEKPDQTPLKEGFIRLIIGGALFALPLIFDVAKTSVSNGVAGADVQAGAVKKATFNVS